MSWLLPSSRVKCRVEGTRAHAARESRPLTPSPPVRTHVSSLSTHNCCHRFTGAATLNLAITLTGQRAFLGVYSMKSCHESSEPMSAREADASYDGARPLFAREGSLMVVHEG
jgi:hypothetical protein